RKFVFEVQNDLLEHQLFIKTICLGAEAKDELHVVEVEAKITHNDRPVPIASLRPSVLPMVRVEFLFRAPSDFTTHCKDETRVRS
ncbi:NPM protein, partial [Polyodon spathula]|nr:NPM protein [Polyodon spathula]